MQWEHVLLWLGVIIILSVIEASTASMTTIWFAASALASLVAALLKASLLVQVLLCIIIGVALLFFTRPLVRRYIHTKRVNTNADRVLGQIARVTEAIDNTAPKGAVYVLGKEWTARSESGNIIEPDTRVTVIRIDGVKLWVQELNP